ncbi:MAG: helix-turn-helix transcriptional regulator [Candidatus Latescibacterota bacterium]
MNTATVRALLKARGLSPSDFARRTGVSRQAVSLWLRRERAKLDADHLLLAAQVLGVRAEDLVRPLPGLGAERERLAATLNWDRLYPDLVDLAITAGRGEHRAIARLVEAYGLFATARMLGTRVWDEFPEYRRYIHPARRRPLTTLQEWHLHRTAT